MDKWLIALGVAFGVINFWMQASYTFRNRGKKLGKVLAMPLFLKLNLLSVFGVMKSFEGESGEATFTGLFFSAIFCITTGVAGYYNSIKYLEGYRGGKLSKVLFYVMIIIIFLAGTIPVHQEIYKSLTIGFLVGGTVFLLTGFLSNKFDLRDIWRAIKKLGVIIMRAFKKNTRP